jgi:hypothetical protein
VSEAQKPGLERLLPEEICLPLYGVDTRFTIGEAARRDVPGRLLKLNHQRCAEEVAAGLHEAKAKIKAKAEVEKEMKAPNPKRPKTTKDDGGALPLF